MNKQITLVNYSYPQTLLPEFHTALYQLLVGVEQSHSRERQLQYCKRLRELADSAFFDVKIGDK